MRFPKGLLGTRLLLATIAFIPLVSGFPASYADRLIEVKTVANVNESSLVSAMANIQNYPQIFPDNVRYVKVLDNKTDLVDMYAGVNGFFFDTKATCQRTDDGTYTVRVVSGDLAGTTMTTSMNKTWGFDGTPGMGTEVNISMDLKTSGALAWLLDFVPDRSLSYALENGFDRFVSYAQK